MTRWILKYLGPRVNKRHPLIGSLMMIVAAGYTISPVDLVPDAVPAVGTMDDLIVMAVAILFSRVLRQVTIEREKGLLKKFVVFGFAAIAVGYTISPVDLVPDAVPYAGTIDDCLIAMSSICWTAIGKAIPAPIATSLQPFVARYGVA